MTVHLTPEQERRIEAIIHSGAYQSVEDVVEAALSAIEQRPASGFEGADDELETLLIEGMNSAEQKEEDFWASVNSKTGALLARRKPNALP